MSTTGGATDQLLENLFNPNSGDGIQQDVDDINIFIETFDDNATDGQLLIKQGYREFGGKTFSSTPNTTDSNVMSRSSGICGARQLDLGNSFPLAKIALFGGMSAGAALFGMGIEPGTLSYNVPTGGSAHRFFIAHDIDAASGGTEAFRIGADTIGVSTLGNTSYIPFHSHDDIDVGTDVVGSANKSIIIYGSNAAASARFTASLSNNAGVTANHTFNFPDTDGTIRVGPDSIDVWDLTDGTTTQSITGHGTSAPTAKFVGGDCITSTLAANTPSSGDGQITVGVNGYSGITDGQLVLRTNSTTVGGITHTSAKTASTVCSRDASGFTEATRYTAGGAIGGTPFTRGHVEVFNPTGTNHSILIGTESAASSGELSFYTDVEGGTYRGFNLETLYTTDLMSITSESNASAKTEVLNIKSADNAIHSTAKGEVLLHGSLAFDNTIYSGAGGTYKSSVVATDPTANRTITLPDSTGTVVLESTDVPLGNISVTSCKFDSAGTSFGSTFTAAASYAANNAVTIPDFAGTVAISGSLQEIMFKKGTFGIGATDDLVVVGQGQFASILSTTAAEFRGTITIEATTGNQAMNLQGAATSTLTVSLGDRVAVDNESTDWDNMSGSVMTFSSGSTLTVNAGATVNGLLTSADIATLQTMQTSLNAVANGELVTGTGSANSFSGTVATDVNTASTVMKRDGSKACEILKLDDGGLGGVLDFAHALTGTENTLLAAGRTTSGTVPSGEGNVRIECADDGRTVSIGCKSFPTLLNTQSTSTNNYYEIHFGQEAGTTVQTGKDALQSSDAESGWNRNYVKAQNLLAGTDVCPFRRIQRNRFISMQTYRSTYATGAINYAMDVLGSVAWVDGNNKNYGTPQGYAAAVGYLSAGSAYRLGQVGSFVDLTCDFTAWFSTGGWAQFKLLLYGRNQSSTTLGAWFQAGNSVEVYRSLTNQHQSLSMTFSHAIVYPYITHVYLLCNSTFASITATPAGGTAATAQGNHGDMFQLTCNEMPYYET